MPVPYMGSKRKSAYQIKNVITAHVKDKNINTIIELFCGGFSVGEVFYMGGRNVIANDKNKYVVALIDQTINKGLDESKCLEFIDRDKFKDIITNPNKYDERYVGYTQCLWSFGNNQKGYLLGKDRETIYKKVYDMVVYKKVDETLKKLIPQKYIDGILKQSDRHKRRMAFRKVWNVIGKKEFQLESLERLQSLESLERLQSLEITSKSYEEVGIPSNAIVYCDPPYKGTAEYSEGMFDHTKFREYVRNLSKTNQVFISEYQAPEDFKVIYEFPQKSTLSSKGTQSHNRQPNEKVFTI